MKLPYPTPNTKPPLQHSETQYPPFTETTPTHNSHTFEQSQRYTCIRTTHRRTMKKIISIHKKRVALHPICCCQWSTWSIFAGVAQLGMACSCMCTHSFLHSPQCSCTPSPPLPPSPSPPTPPTPPTSLRCRFSLYFCFLLLLLQF